MLHLTQTARGGRVESACRSIHRPRRASGPARSPGCGGPTALEPLTLGTRWKHSIETVMCSMQVSVALLALRSEARWSSRTSGAQASMQCRANKHDRPVKLNRPRKKYGSLGRSRLQFHWTVAAAGPMPRPSVTRAALASWAGFAPGGASTGQLFCPPPLLRSVPMPQQRYTGIR